MKTSPAGVTLIKQFEGFPYGGRPYQDIADVWTIGYGHTQGVGPHTVPINQAQAERLLLGDLNAHYEPTINALGLSLDQHQYDALVSFIYNVGAGGVAPGTGVGKALRGHEWKAAADHILDWDKAKVHGRTVVVAGLLRRRKAERALFLSATDPMEGFTAHERSMIREYDRLLRTRRDITRRRELRRAMRLQRKLVWRAAQQFGWEAHHYTARYHALHARSS